MARNAAKSSPKSRCKEYRWHYSTHFLCAFSRLAWLDFTGAVGLIDPGASFDKNCGGCVATRCVDRPVGCASHPKCLAF
jgi:hypothetical protein